MIRAGVRVEDASAGIFLDLLVVVVAASVFRAPSVGRTIGGRVPVNNDVNLICRPRFGFFFAYTTVGVAVVGVSV